VGLSFAFGGIGGLVNGSLLSTAVGGFLGRPYGEAALNGNWGLAAKGGLNTLGLISGVPPLMIASGLNVLSDNAAYYGYDEISRGLGYASVAVSIFSIGKDLKDSVELWNLAKGAKESVGSQIEQLTYIKDKTPEIATKIASLKKYKQGLGQLQLGLSVKPAATLIGTGVGAVIAGKSSDWEIGIVLLGAASGASYGSRFSGIQVGFYSVDDTLSGDMQVELFTGKPFGNIQATIPIRAKIYGIPVVTKDIVGKYSTNGQWPGQESLELKNLSGKEVQWWSPNLL
jgi:hypothetical protein